MARTWISGLALLLTGALLMMTGCAMSGPAASMRGVPDWAADAIRLHVVANSDSEEDQALKRAVRDAIVNEVGPLFDGLSTPQQAREAIRRAAPQMERIGARVVASHGKRYPVRALFGRFDFPTKAYGKTLLPAGRYDALKILIGEAKGANWWCVLFPPMCYVDWVLGVVEEPAPGSGGAQTVTTPRPLTLRDVARMEKAPPVRGRWAILEWLRAKR